MKYKLNIGDGKLFTPGTSRPIREFQKAATDSFDTMVIKNSISEYNFIQERFHVSLKLLTAISQKTGFL